MAPDNPRMKGGNMMVKRNYESFVKRQKEIKRKQKAQEKQARRQGKKDKPAEEQTGDGAEREGENEYLCRKFVV